VAGTLDGSVGVPGPQGPAGSQGPAGAAGQGVPVGGTAGQFLTKIDGTDYNTDWTTVNLSAYLLKSGGQITGNISSSNSAAFNTSNGVNVSTSVGAGSIYVYNSEFQTGVTIETDGLSFFGFGSSDKQTQPYIPSQVLQVSNDLSDLADAATARTNLGLGTMAVESASTYAPISSPALTGNPTAPTATFGDNDTSIATTAFVQAGLLGGTANARNLEVYVRNQSGSTIPAGSIVYISGATGNRPLITLAQANNDANSAQTIGFVKTSIANNAFGYVIVRGELENIDTSALTEGVQLYLSPTTAGTWTTTKPSAPQHLVYVGIVIRAHPTQGVILVAVQNGYELEELHDVAIGTLANNDLLAYESSTDLWKNKTFSALGLLTSADAASTYLTQANAASTYAPIASPTFTGTVTIPAGASISGFAPLASPTFTGTPSLPTGTTAVTQSPGNNTTAVATTAFVQQEVPDFATIPQSLTGSSNTVTISPLSFYIGSINPAFYNPSVAQLSSTVTGTGSSSSANANGYTVQLGSTAGAYVTRSQNVWPNRVGVTGNLQWNRPVGFGARVAVYSRMDSTAQFGISFGQATATLATPTVRSIGCYFAATALNTPGVLVLEVHDGTNYNTVNSSFTPTFNQLFDVECYSDGNGNAYLYVNGSQVATSANAPSTNGGTTYQTILQAGYRTNGTPTGNSNGVFQCLKYLTN
jgi:hypothetical protein